MRADSSYTSLKEPVDGERALVAFKSYGSSISVDATYGPDLNW